MHDFGLAFDLVSQILKEELLVVVAGAAREHFKAIWCLFTWLDEEEALICQDHFWAAMCCRRKVSTVGCHSLYMLCHLVTSVEFPD